MTIIYKKSMRLYVAYYKKHTVYHYDRLQATKLLTRMIYNGN